MINQFQHDTVRLSLSKPDDKKFIEAIHCIASHFDRFNVTHTLLHSTFNFPLSTFN